MTDSSTIDEAIDLLECAGWKVYSKAVRDQRDQLTAISLLVLALQAHSKECGWNDVDQPIADLLTWFPQ